MLPILIVIWNINDRTNFDTLPDLTTATSNLPISFHPGAAVYYAEQGYKVEVGGKGAISAVSASQDGQ